MYINNLSIKVMTPDGMMPFDGIQKVKKSGRFEILFDNGESLKCAPGHRIYTLNGWKCADELLYTDVCVLKEGTTRPFQIDFDPGEYEYYDLVNVSTNQYFTNNILSHNCEFLGSTSTLISGAKLRTLSYSEPIKDNNDLKIYQEPEENRLYVIVVDTSRGVEGDYSAFKVFDTTELPYKDVATYRNNLIDPMLYPQIILPVAKHYNNAYVLVETNDVGQQVADILFHDLEYENMFFTDNINREGTRITSGFRGNAHAGVRTTNAVKKLGCSNFKTLIENDKLIIQDYHTVQEMFRFIHKGSSYAAEEGNDDCVMC
ncbi:hypothetical protein EBU71_20890, partial [bacterium]|nr:hypothetical protein [Candidatus Elulimicrobium humile]